RESLSRIRIKIRGFHSEGALNQITFAPGPLRLLIPRPRRTFMSSTSTFLPRADRPRSKEIKNRREQRKQRRHTALCRFSVFFVASCWFVVVMLSVWAGIEDKTKDSPDEAPTSPSMGEGWGWGEERQDFQKELSI